MPSTVIMGYASSIAHPLQLTEMEMKASLAIRKGGPGCVSPKLKSGRASEGGSPFFVSPGLVHLLPISLTCLS